ncbi:MAG: class I SAM-dependent methyltransferase [Synechococcaceae cyanobacterium SM2_3_2]|nr:class I SAM-dependent methyltransferase [Synechococcaceae cyanobacterium SM2_3_2]
MADNTTIANLVQAQFDEFPYPNVPIEQTVTDNAALFVNNLTTARYLRDRKVVKPEGKVFLNAGCGSGWETLVVATANPGAHYVGTDISQESVKMARQRFAYQNIPNARFEVMDISDMSSLGQEFDFIACNDVLYLIDDQVAGLRGMRQVLKPDGIIRTNVHSLYQRQFIFHMQEAMELLGVMDEPAAKAIPILREVMDALNDGSFVKSHWNGDQIKTTTGILANFLLRSDKGFTVPQVFEMLRQAELDFINMVNWQNWKLERVLNKPVPYSLKHINKLSEEERLHFIELVFPNMTRLIDFWCGHKGLPEPEPFSSQEWWNGQVQAHPLLLSLNAKSAFENAIRDNGPVNLNGWPGAEGNITIDSFSTRWLISAFEQPVPVQAMVAKAMALMDWSQEEAFAQVQANLKFLEERLILLLDSPSR